MLKNMLIGFDRPLVLSFCIPSVMATLFVALCLRDAVSAELQLKELPQAQAEVERLRNDAKYDDAILLAEQILAARQAHNSHANAETAAALNDLGALYRLKGRYEDSERALQQSLRIKKQLPDVGDSDIALAYNELGVLYENMGQYQRAHEYHLQALPIRKKALGLDDPLTAQSMNNLGVTHYYLGNFAEAERLFKRSIAIKERVVGMTRFETTESVNNLAATYDAQGRYEESEPLYRRVIDADTNELGPNHPFVGSGLNNLGDVLRRLGRYREAEPLHVRAVEIFKRAYAEKHQLVANSMNDLALLYKLQRKYDAAEYLYRQALEIDREVLGPDSPQVSRDLNNLGELYRAKGAYDRAEPLLLKAIAIRKERLGAQNPKYATSLSNLGYLYRDMGRLEQSLSTFSDAKRIMIMRSRRRPQAVHKSISGKAVNEAALNKKMFEGFIDTAFKLGGAVENRCAKRDNESFDAAQWILVSETANSLSLMAVRLSQGAGKLSEVIRERQDLLTEWQVKDRLLISARALSPDKRDALRERTLSTRLAEIDKRLSSIDLQLAKDFPDYAAVANPEPLSISDVQELLHDDEAMVLFLKTPTSAPWRGQTFAWVITKRVSCWVRSRFKSFNISESVQMLRCGLDEEEWSGLSRSTLCGKLLGIGQPEDADPLPFHLDVAHELYEGLFGQVEEIIEGKRLLIVPSGPLTSLPFHVLVTKKPETTLPKAFEGYRNVAWLGRAHAISVLPSVSSLRALRKHAKQSPSAKAYIGYGNPELDGNGTCKVAKVPDKCPNMEVASAASWQMATDTVRALVRGHSGRRSPDLAKVFAIRGDETVVANVRALCPLQDTAYEIGCVAERLGVPTSEIRLGASATEADIKALSESGKLASYRIVHFATHGLLAGDVAAIAKRQGEPALVLTPPKDPKDADDGLLMASEVMQLKLNANWVILSACNTAAGDKLGAEALSGLARAFFYAGVRALLVSHWPVYSDAAVHLTTRAFAEMNEDEGLARAAALQRSMIALMDDPAQEDNPHPAVWAPFVVVGE
jgi:CHAT domain-containing protein/tetratricopeptide (TPR) repeat protein